MQHLNYRNFTSAIILSLVSAIIILSVSFSIGKDQFFLLLNADLGPFADYFFAAFTWLGDGILWIALLGFILWKKRKALLPLIISAFVFTTAFTQVCKYVIVPDELRPTKAITNGAFIHTVEGVTLHTVSSFPSGHTATAFTFYLLFSLMLPYAWWVGIGLLYALLVAYSRIYLAQHFPLDTGAGMIVAIASVSLALWVQKSWMKKKGLKQPVF